MNKKLLTFWFVTFVFVASMVVQADTSKYHLASKHVGLSLGVSKEEATAKKVNPCVALGCTPWHYAIGDSTTKKAYRCSGNVVLPSSLTKDKKACFGSAAAAKKVGYKVEELISSSRRR